MINGVIEFIVIMLSAMTLENVVFTRFIGVDSMNLRIKNLKAAVVFGMTATVSLLISVTLNYAVRLILQDLQMSAYTKNILCFLSVISAYVILVFGMKYFNGEMYKKMKHTLIIAVFSNCVYGVVLITTIQKQDFLTSIAYAAGSGLGFTVALIMIYAGRERISMLSVPKAFKGVPIMLLYLGILSLAIYGLIGHQLPS